MGSNNLKIFHNEPKKAGVFGMKAFFSKLLIFDTKNSFKYSDVAKGSFYQGAKFFKAATGI
jgi:hypothetical protein